MMKNFSWVALRDLALLVIGIALVVTLNKINNNVVEAEEAADRATATQCRLLVMFEQPISPEGTCGAPEVRSHYEHLEIVPISDVVKQILIDIGVTP